MLTLSADSISNIIWYIDASHQTHHDCKGHTGSILTFGHGTTTSSSNKHKIPSKSSTESKIIGLHDKSSDVLWTRYFLEAQGYTISSDIVYQDNMSTLSLAKNGYVSSSKRTKHIKANISLSTIITMCKSLNFDTVPPNKCGQMFWLSLSKDLNFDGCVHSSWIALSIMLKTFNFYRRTTLHWILLTVLHQRAPFLILHPLGHSLPLFFRWNRTSHWSHLHRRGVLRRPYHFLPVLNQ